MSRDTLVTGSKLTALANSIREKADISDSLTLDGMKTAVDNIQTGGDLELVKKLIERPSDTDLVIPEGVKKIGEYTFSHYISLVNVGIPSSVIEISSNAFEHCYNLANVTIPDSVTKLGSYIFDNCSNLASVKLGEGCTSLTIYMFRRCYKLTNVIFGNNVRRLEANVFASCTGLIDFTIPNTITQIAGWVFQDCSNLATLFIPNSIVSFGSGAFYGCSKLENVTIENGFNCNNLNLSYSTLYTVPTIVSWLNALADRTGDTAYTLTIGSTNLAKLTSDQIAIATNKNWNLA